HSKRDGHGRLGCCLRVLVTVSNLPVNGITGRASGYRHRRSVACNRRLLPSRAERLDSVVRLRGKVQPVGKGHGVPCELGWRERFLAKLLPKEPDTPDVASRRHFGTKALYRGPPRCKMVVVDSAKTLPRHD